MNASFPNACHDVIQEHHWEEPSFDPGSVTLALEPILHSHSIRQAVAPADLLFILQASVAHPR